MRKPRKGESLLAYLRRNRAMPNDPLNQGMTDADAIAEGIQLSDSHPSYGEGNAFGMTLGPWEFSEKSVLVAEGTRYYAIGPGPGTNLIKEVEGVMHILNYDGEWEYYPGALRFLMGDTDTRLLSIEEAKDLYTRFTGQRWLP